MTFDRKEWTRRWREANKERLKEYSKKYRAAHLDELKAYQEEYYSDPVNKKKRDDGIRAWRKSHREELTTYQREYRETHREELDTYKREKEAAMGETFSQKAYREHPERYKEYYSRWKAYLKVRSVTYNAIKSGKLTRLPCENCGEQRVEAHHTDYNKPFDVMWLCTRCHKDWHRKHTAIPPKDS